MNKRFEEWKDKIREYCEENNLSFEKVKKMSKCYNEDINHPSLKNDSLKKLAVD